MNLGKKLDMGGWIQLFLTKFLLSNLLDDKSSDKLEGRNLSEIDILWQLSIQTFDGAVNGESPEI